MRRRAFPRRVLRVRPARGAGRRAAPDLQRRGLRQAANPGMNQTESARKSRAFGALLLGAAAIAFAPIFVRLSDTGPGASAFWRVALAITPLWFWVWMSPRSMHIRSAPWKSL